MYEVYANFSCDHNVHVHETIVHNSLDIFLHNNNNNINNNEKIK